MEKMLIITLDQNSSDYQIEEGVKIKNPVGREVLHDSSRIKVVTLAEMSFFSEKNVLQLSALKYVVVPKRFHKLESP